MSRRHQIQLTPEEQAAFLQQPHKAALSTLDKDGFPHVVAMGFLAKDGAIYMTSYARAQKVLNIRRNPKVGLMIEAGQNYAEYQGVIIRGQCEIIEEPEQVQAIMQAMLAKQAGPAADQPPREALASAPKRAVLKVTPEKISSWDHTKLGGKY
jgi:PPOX class probable F420-dependent enzyme